MSAGSLTRIVVLMLMLLAMRVVATAHHVTARPLARPFSAFPLEVGEWSGVNGPELDAETLRILRPDAYLNRIYAHQTDAAVGLYVAYYAAQQQGESIHSPRNCLPGNGWQPLSYARSEVDTGSRHIPVNRYIVERRGERQLLLYWYQGRSRVLANEYVNKLYLLHDALRLGRTDGALVRISTPMSKDARGSDAAAGAFIRALMPYLEQWIL